MQAWFIIVMVHHKSSLNVRLLTLLLLLPKTTFQEQKESWQLWNGVNIRHAHFKSKHVMTKFTHFLIICHWNTHTYTHTLTNIAQLLPTHMHTNAHSVSWLVIRSFLLNAFCFFMSLYNFHIFFYTWKLLFFSHLFGKCDLSFATQHTHLVTCTGLSRMNWMPFTSNS